MNFRPDDLNGSAEDLLDFLGLTHERDVPVESFTIDGVTTVVGEGKYKSALFLLYLAILASSTDGKEFILTGEMQQKAREYFGTALCKDAENPETKHTTIRALLGDNVTISVKLI